VHSEKSIWPRADKYEIRLQAQIKNMKSIRQNLTSLSPKRRSVEATIDSTFDLLPESPGA
jgi:hypothetical protein